MNIYDAQPQMNHDSPSALVSPAKSAKIGYNGMVESYQVGERVIYSLSGSLVKELLCRWRSETDALHLPSNLTNPQANTILKTVPMTPSLLEISAFIGG
ncbi:MAG: hypothetical protein KJ638_02860 [Chloroflexi bacterium]|nr:hypothetical protein [Chloroflexota bacterium]